MDNFGAERPAVVDVTKGPVTNVSAGCHGRSDLGGTIARVGTEPSGAVRYGILGPLSVATDIGPTRMASRAQRLLLAVLLVEANRVVSADRLADELWADDVPCDPAGALRTQISRLRKVLPPTVSLVTEEGGYRLLVAPEELDATRFDRLLALAATIASGRCLFWTRRWR